MKRKSITYLFVLFFSLYAAAQPATSYYNYAESKSGAALKSALHEIISDGYIDNGYAFLYTIFKSSDTTPAGQPWDIYSTCNWEFDEDECGNYVLVCDCFNREHSVPQSWFNKVNPQRNDAFHIYPTDGKVNQIRDNDPYGETNSNPIGGKALGKSGTSSFPGYSGKVFEPVDEYKGDLARTYFYFATRYEDYMPHMTGAGTNFNKTKYPSFPEWTINLLLKWHRQDPVSQKEIDRNNAIEVYQKNRNPFIDYPELAEHIWGDKNSTPWSKTITTNPVILLPVPNSSLEFGNISYQENNSLLVDVKAANLTGPISLSLSGEHSSDFSLSKTTLTKLEAETGYKLTISCNPQSLGNISALLTFTGGGIETTSVHLKAGVSDNFMATDATEISSTAFTANWTSSAGATGYLLDVYKYNITGTMAETLLEEDFDNNTLSEGWDTDGFTEISKGEIRLASNSRFGLLRTPPVDLSDITILQVRAKSFRAADNANLEIRIDNELIETITTGASYEDFTIEIPEMDLDARISFTANQGKQVYINYIEMRTDGDVAEAESLPGYPVQTGNTLSYRVKNLQPEQSYYYTVTPQGNGALISNEVALRTTETGTRTDRLNAGNDLVLYHAAGNLYLTNIETGTVLTIYNITGEKLLELKSSSSQAVIPLREKGVFIIHWMKENQLTGARKVLLH